jgi:hypothetical protein
MHHHLTPPSERRRRAHRHELLFAAQLGRRCARGRCPTLQAAVPGLWPHAVAALAPAAAAGRLAAWLPADGGSGRGGAALALLGNLAEAGGEALEVKPGAPLVVAGAQFLALRRHACAQCSPAD